MSATAALNPPKDFELPIEGMTCASCVLRVGKALKAPPGVESAAVNLATEEATVRASAAVAAAELAAAVRKAGYEVPARCVELHVDGMTCASCVARVEKALLKVPGVSSASVNVATEKASIEALGNCPSPRWRPPSTRPAVRPGRCRHPRPKWPRHGRPCSDAVPG